MPVRQVGSNSLSSLLDFVILEKAPSGFKPLTGLLGGGGDKPSGGEDEEKVPEGQRVYVDSKEDAPDGVEILTGKRGGSYYDMSQLNQEDHGDAITDVFNNLMDELLEAQSPEAVAGREKEISDLVSRIDDMSDAFIKQHPASEKYDKASAEYDARQAEIIYEGEASGEDFITETIKKLEDDKELNSLDSKKKKLQDKIARDTSKTMVNDKGYQSLRDQLKEMNDKVDNVVGEIQSKLGNALIHSFKSSPFKVDDMAFSIDPDMKYTDNPKDWEAHITKGVEESVQGTVKTLPDESKKAILQGSVLGEWESDADDGKVVAVFMNGEAVLKKAEELGIPPSKLGKDAQIGGIVRDIREEISQSSLGLYDGNDNTFKASPNVWAKVSKLDDSDGMSPDMRSALHVVVHESLHSMGHEGRHTANKAHLEERSKGLAEAGITKQEAFNNFKVFMEEAPVELLSHAIMGRKYNKDLVGKDVFTDKAFSEGSGSREQTRFEGYTNSTPHVARWALAHSGGSPTKARALLGKMRDVGSGQGEVDKFGEKSQSGIVDNHRLKNEYTASYTQYLNQYQKENPDEAHRVSHLTRGLTEGQDNKYGENKLPNLSLRPEIKGAKPTHDEDGNISESGHLDLMYLIYGKD